MSLFGNICAPSMEVERHHQPPHVRHFRLPRQLSAFLPKPQVIPDDLATRYGGKFELVKQGMRCDVYRNDLASIRAIALRRLTNPFMSDFDLIHAVMGLNPPRNPLEESGRPSHAARVSDPVRVREAFSHSNIVSLKEIIYTPYYFFLVTERLLGPNLPDKLTSLETAGASLEEPEVAKIFNQLVSAIAWLHAHGIIHRTLSSYKWVLSAEETWKLCDFTCAVQVTETRPWYTENESGVDALLVGNPYYTAPEIFEKRFWSAASDVWAMGVVLFEVVFSGSMPFFTRKPRDLSRVILHSAPALEDAELCPSLVQLLSAMLNRNPSLRPTAAAVLEHPWMVDPVQAAGEWRRASVRGSLRKSVGMREDPLPQPSVQAPSA